LGCAQTAVLASAAARIRVVLFMMIPFFSGCKDTKNKLKIEK
jgi:hypothetical protein